MAISAEPVGWGFWAMVVTSAMARSAENSVAGALAGTGAGVLWLHVPSARPMARQIQNPRKRIVFMGVAPAL